MTASTTASGFPCGKNTSGGGRKPRNTYLSREVEQPIHLDSNSEGFAADETGDPDWRKVNSHDLHCYFAHHLLVEEQMNSRVVMKVGRWEKFESIGPYPAKPSENTVNKAFEECGHAKCP